MKKPKTYKTLLAGNPNTGKSTLFNILTDRHQHTGNYPGVTVQRTAGTTRLPNGTRIQWIDLPGAYGLHPRSKDEEPVLHEILGSEGPYHGIIVTATPLHLKRNLLLLSQLADLDVPLMLVITMCDELDRKGIRIDTRALENELGIPVVLFSAKDPDCHGGGTENIIRRLPDMMRSRPKHFFDNYGIDTRAFKLFRQRHPDENPYRLWLIYTEQDKLPPSILHRYPDLPPKDKEKNIVEQRVRYETIRRHADLDRLVKRVLQRDLRQGHDPSTRLDRLLLHRVLGPVIFALVMLLMFQAVFAWAQVPMHLIDAVFGRLADWLHRSLPAGEIRSLLADGIVPGIGGVLIFVPQIAVLFFFIALLEESGYMSRAVVLTDKLLRPFGLSGKSVVPLLSATACAVPAIMGARTIDDRKRRLITMLVTPFVSCSARLPVYALIVAMVVPAKTYAGGLINLQGLVMAGLYALGFAAALGSAWILNKGMHSPYDGYFLLEMPPYRLPYFRNLWTKVWHNVRLFITGAGKYIMAFSVLIWFLANHGGEEFHEGPPPASPAEAAAWRLEHSYLGRAGKLMEPAIRPLGWDWKIGIGVLTSFAARETFVSTMATIYAAGNEEDASLIQRLRTAVHSRTGMPLFTLASGLSLLIFYVLAMQCFSTLAVLRRETGSWLWPSAAFAYMTGLAYVAAWITYVVVNQLLAVSF